MRLLRVYSRYRARCAESRSLISTCRRIWSNRSVRGARACSGAVISVAHARAPRKLAPCRGHPSAAVQASYDAAEDVGRMSRRFLGHGETLHTDEAHGGTENADDAAEYTCAYETFVRWCSCARRGVTAPRAPRPGRGAVAAPRPRPRVHGHGRADAPHPRRAPLPGRRAAALCALCDPAQRPAPRAPRGAHGSTPPCAAAHSALCDPAKCPAPRVPRGAHKVERRRAQC